MDVNEEDDVKRTMTFTSIWDAPPAHPGTAKRQRGSNIDSRDAMTG
jgi:hypothetical protein